MSDTPQQPIEEEDPPQPIEDDFDWEVIIETILEQNCIVFLGPRIFANEKYQSLEDIIADHLQAGQNENIRNYFEKDALFQFSSPAAKTKTLIGIKKFLREADFPEARELYRKLAHIPFHVVFSMTPDTLLQEVFDEEQVNYKFDYYLKNHPPNDQGTPLLATANTPLLYNMFGYIPKKESMILTHDDLFEYFNSILGENSMHPDLKQAVKKAENFLFLGVSFDKWYMQLLLQLLDSIHEKKGFLRYASHEQLNKEAHRLFTDQFRIEFVNKDVKGFVDTLYAQFEESGQLRNKAGAKEKVTVQLRKLVQNSKLLDAMDGLLTFLEKHLGNDSKLSGDTLEQAQDLRDEVSQLMARYRRLQERINKGVIRQEEMNLAYNEITDSLLKYIKTVESFE